MNRTRGRPKLDWLRMFKSQLQEELDLTIDDAMKSAVDKKKWKSLELRAQGSRGYVKR